MTLAESARLTFPVMTSRRDDLRAAARYLTRRMETFPGDERPDGTFRKLLQKYFDVMRPLCRLEHSDAPVTYVSPEEGELVARVSDWLRDHPEERAA